MSKEESLIGSTQKLLDLGGCVRAVTAARTQPPNNLLVHPSFSKIGQN
jgi:hypothetical protein